MKADMQTTITRNRAWRSSFILTWGKDKVPASRPVVAVRKIELGSRCVPHQQMHRCFRLLTFTAGDRPVADSDPPHDAYSVQMFGINGKGDTACIHAEGFRPFFYVKVQDHWGATQLAELKRKIQNKLALEEDLARCSFVRKKTLYGFDGGKEHKFVWLAFRTERAMKSAKAMWYQRGHSGQRLRPGGLIIHKGHTKLYEAQIPPLLRLFHIKKISPSGWVLLPKSGTRSIKGSAKTTTCTYECAISYKDIKPLPRKETPVPYKICSFDIEASSSHGDFPVPKKDYKKLATNLVDAWDYGAIESEAQLIGCAASAFNGGDSIAGVDEVYTSVPLAAGKVVPLLTRWAHSSIGLSTLTEGDAEPMGEITEAEGQAPHQTGTGCRPHWGAGAGKNASKADFRPMEALETEDLPRAVKISLLNAGLTETMPQLQGDEVTFIGSTFMRSGETEPYRNHCLVVGECDGVAGAEIASCSTEERLLVSWANLIQEEDPDIIIGYNIFGFDYAFMYERAVELGCEEAMLKLSRVSADSCLSYNWKTKRTGLEENTIVLASGEHQLRFPKIGGRLQIDLYNYLRRDFQLAQYKLDYVAGQFIGDRVLLLDYDPDMGQTRVRSGNLVGLQPGAFVSFEEEAHSVDQYAGGKKFEVASVEEGGFVVKGEVAPDMTKRVRWGLAKDDVTPQDIFRMTNEGPDSKAIIAKYCIQDCNLVQHLLRKVDVLTGYVEMAALCSVPMDYLVMRGQGVKLTSYISKKCREKGTLMPVIDKGRQDDAYEGAIVLDPKCDLYLQDPVACVDFSSLYPSSMISENISHDSKVWTKEHDEHGELIDEWGDKDAAGNYVYDNLPGYKYVDVTYDTYKWRPKSKRPGAAMEKRKMGTKTCRFAQFPEGYGVMPSILLELLSARKATRKLIKTEKDEFMRNILDKRQQSIKMTANSLYGQTGAKTSSFYEQDCAAATTATGRLLLTYAQRVIEEAYDGDLVEACGRRVHAKAEYVYGDTDSVFFKFHLSDEASQPIKGKEALPLTIALAKEVGALATQFLKAPHDLEYEKTFWPFLLLSKKRYVGMLYEEDVTKCKRKSMGIVLKRRDNAPVVKDVYGGVIDILMKQMDVQAAVDFMQGCLARLAEGGYPMDKLIITKALRSGYKNPKQIAHKVLADRMGRRDPGNKPKPGDRIAFAYIVNTTKKALQGDKIETPEHIASAGLKLNYEFYITNQLMKPLQQVFALVLEQLPAFRRKKGHSLRRWVIEQDRVRAACATDLEAAKKLESLRNKEAKALLFAPHLHKAGAAKRGDQSMSQFFASA